MPHSYGALFSGVGLEGPTNWDSNTEPPAKPAPKPSMIRMGRKPYIGPGSPQWRSRTRELVPRMIKVKCYPRMRQLGNEAMGQWNGAMQPATQCQLASFHCPVASLPHCPIASLPHYLDRISVRTRC